MALAMTSQSAPTGAPPAVLPPAAASASTGASAPALSAPAVPTAFSVGWLLADLRAWAADGRPPTAGNPDPSLLTRTASPEVWALQLSSKVSVLRADILGAEVAQTELDSVDARLRVTLDDVIKDALTEQSADRLVESVSATVTAASARMGEALELGYDLANTRRLPAVNDDMQARRAFASMFGARAIRVQSALADLASSLPDHSARAVSLSLAQWQHWAAHPTLNKDPVVWPHPGVGETLTRQGEVWRTLLAGEKLGKDMLSADDYFTALRYLLWGQLRRRPWVWVAVMAFVGAIVGGIVVATSFSSTGNKVVASVFSILGVLGISTASLKGFAGGVARDIENQVWNAELDFAIAEAITVPPGEWRVKLRKIDTPPPRGFDPNVARNARVVRKVSKAIENHRARRLKRYLYDKCTFQPSEGGASVSTDVAGHLIDRADFVGAKPYHVASGAPSRLWSVHRVDSNGTAADYFLVWTFRQRPRWWGGRPKQRIAYLDQHTSADAARDEAQGPRLDQ